ncbi:MAG TPA: hypothetical protein VGI77_05360 [Gaiellaceae bacterium]|jgi:hypothetical protein
MSFWKKLMGRRDAAAAHRAEDAQVETESERHIVDEGVEGLAADARVEERLGGVDPNRLVDDEFKP